MIKRIVKLTFEHHHVDAFRQIFTESKQKISAFEGCHHVELLQGIRPNNIFFTLSLWENEAALDRYRQSELFKTTWAKTKKLFADKPAAWSLTLEDQAK